MHLWISRPGRAIDEVARRVHAHDVIRAAERIHRDAAGFHVPAPVENFLGHERHAVRHLGEDKVLLSLRNGFGNAFDQLFEVGAMGGVIAVGTAILARRRGVRVCGVLALLELALFIACGSAGGYEALGVVLTGGLRPVR